MTEANRTNERDHRLQRLFVEQSFRPGEPVTLDKAQSHYLSHVLRLGADAPLMVFNGMDGEWLAHIETAAKSGVVLSLDRQTRPQTFGADLHYLFAPLKHARLDYMVQKATEMGASRLVPVLTQRTQASRVNLDRMRANAIEAAEQCGLVGVPEIAAEEKLARSLERLEPERALIFCDEDAPQVSPLAALASAGPGPLAVLVGPEGGFTHDERRAILALPRVVRLSLGPRIMRADTAAVAVLALVQATLGDWPR